MLSSFGRPVATLMLLAAFVPHPTAASEATGIVAAHVVTSDGTPVTAARVAILRGGTTRSANTSAQGQAALGDVPPGTYAISAEAPQYERLAPSPIQIRSGATTDVTLVLARSATSLTTIGSVTTAGSATVSTSSAPTQALATQRYAARGFTRVSDVLADALSTTVIRQGSGSAAAPQSVALRGPDPTETLVDIDGHEINSGVTGDFDLSLLDPADFASVQVVYGISPSALVGPSTIGGAINLRTLEPTAKRQGFLRTTIGSNATFAQTLQTTGSVNRLGYAVSLHQTSTANTVSQTRVTDAAGETERVGSDVDAETSLAKIRYAFGHAGESYAQVTVRDQSVVRDLSAALTSLAGDGTFVPSIGSRLLGHNAGYGFDLQVPLGAQRPDGTSTTTALFRHLTSFATQSVQGAASGTSTSYFDDRDRIGDDTLEIDRTMGAANLAVKYRLRTEHLTTFDPTLATNVVEQGFRMRPLASQRRFDDVATNGAGVATSRNVDLAQTQASLAVRLGYEPTPQLHYTLAAYQSDFSIFGHSFDPRASVVWTPDTRTSLRASIGTTFQSPQLTELYVPAALPAPDANGHISIGNAALRADHATEYDIGFERLIGARRSDTRLGADLYRTNLRAPAQRLVPVATCAAGQPSLACASYPVNIGAAVYTGAELRAQTIVRGSAVRLGYAIESTYATTVPDAVQNGAIVTHEQFLGVPLHKATLELERQTHGLGYDAGLVYEGRYNELNRGPFATLRASVSESFAGFDITLGGTNLTNADTSRFTLGGAGVPYGGVDGPIATDAYALPGRAVTLSIARHF